MTKPKALYIHIPFCNYICDYCDFTKLQYFSFDVDKYLEALSKEIASYEIGELDTIYVGGGTPTCLSIKELVKLLSIIDPYVKGVKEYTFEANPDSLDKSKLELLYQHHVNRLSIGVESTNDQILENINRHHTFLDVQGLVKEAREIGFNNINVDLILGLPHVSKKMLREDINNLLSLDVNHISCYSLTVSPHTAFSIKGVKEPESDVLRDLYDEVNKILEEHNFVHYEVSNYAKEGYFSLHNLTYWRNERYYGVGLGSSGYIDNTRYTNTKNPKKYLMGQYVDTKEIVNINDDINYQIMLSLRTKEGLDLNAFHQKYDIDLMSTKKAEIDSFIEKGLLKISNDKLIPTYEGMMILDSMLVKLFF